MKKRLAFLFAATVTDESYGVNTAKFEEGGWSVGRAHAREPFLAKLVGAVERGRRARGQRRGHPAGHSLLRHDVHLHLPARHAEGDAGQRGGAAFAILGVYTCKTIGLSGPAILVGALVGVMAALLFTWAKERG